MEATVFELKPSSRLKSPLQLIEQLQMPVCATTASRRVSTFQAISPHEAGSVGRMSAAVIAGETNSSMTSALATAALSPERCPWH